MTKISILGCGWLGLPLAKNLVEKGYEVNGSTTSENKLKALKISGINPYLIAVDTFQIHGTINSFLENSEILIIDIPPKIRNGENGNFVSKIKNLIPYIEKSAVSKVLFVSSTSVYADDNSIVTEQTTPKNVNVNENQLFEAEKLLAQNKHFQTTILRFGGLIGDDRHPIHFLAGKRNLENPDAPVNLIHKSDCIGIILKIISHNIWDQTFNAVAPFHPTREKYYTEKAAKLNLDAPVFAHQKKSMGKTIDSSKLIGMLHYEFLKPQL